MISIIKNVHFTSVQSWTEPFAQRISMVDFGSGGPSAGLKSMCCVLGQDNSLLSVSLYP